jgi:hypothetical protein
MDSGGNGGGEGDIRPGACAAGVCESCRPRGCSKRSLFPPAVGVGVVFPCAFRASRSAGWGRPGDLQPATEAAHLPPADCPLSCEPLPWASAAPQSPRRGVGRLVEAPSRSCHSRMTFQRPPPYPTAWAEAACGEADGGDECREQQRPRAGSNDASHLWAFTPSRVPCALRCVYAGASTGCAACLCELRVNRHRHTDGTCRTLRRLTPVTHAASTLPTATPAGALGWCTLLSPQSLHSPHAVALHCKSNPPPLPLGATLPTASG